MVGSPRDIGGSNSYAARISKHAVKLQTMGHCPHGWGIEDPFGQILSARRRISILQQWT
jgi:hypothetical protein